MFREAMEGAGYFDEPRFNGHVRELLYTWVKPPLTQALHVASVALNRPINKELTEDVRQHLASAEFGLSVWHGLELKGFMLFTMPLPNVLYIAGTMIRPKYQGVGIKAFATRLTVTVFPQIEYIAGRTQSPIVWSSVAGISDKLLPSPLHQDSELQRLRMRVAEELGMSSVVEKGFYGGPLYGEKPKHRDPTVQAWWDSFIDFERGDATLYIARYARNR